MAKSASVDASFESLHQSICDGNIEKVYNFLGEFPNEKVCIDSSGVSALETAIQHKKFQIYSLLISEGFICDEDENLQQKIKQLSDQEKSTIDFYNRKYLKECPEKFLNILSSKCKFFVTADKLSSSKTREVLDSLRVVEGAEELMKILALSNVTIAKDMNNKHICKMNPLKEEIFGSAMPLVRTIYVANTKNQLDWAVTFIHEMTHYICSLIYENGFLPYCKHDLEGEKEFDVIFQEVKTIFEQNQEETDKIIADIFDAYVAKNPNDVKEVKKAEKNQKWELIARIPHILAFYNQDSEKLTELQDRFPNIFNFYRTKFLPDLRIQNVYQAIKLNNDFGLLDSVEKSNWQPNARKDCKIPNNDQKPVLFVSKTPQLALSRIIQELKQKSTQNLVSAVNFKAKNIFVDPKKLEIFADDFGSLIKSSCVEKVVVSLTKVDAEKLELYMNAIGHLECIFVADETDETHLALIKMFINKFEFKRREINFEWADLSEETQDFVKKGEVNFQGQKIEIGELFEKPEKSLDSESLKVLSKNNKNRINCEPSKENWANFIPRIIEKKNNSFEVLSTTDFILDSRKAESFQNFVLISDPAGSGKTFLFKKLCDDLKSAENEIKLKIDPKNEIFPLFLPLKSHIEELKGFTDEGEGSAEDKFVDFVAKMAKFDGLTKAVFAQKFMKGQTMIFFDAFDEISPICKEKTETLFELFQESLAGPKQVQKLHNQTFISTRTHLKTELEKNLKISASSIKTLTYDEQIQFLKNFWQNSTLDQELIQNCAEKLVEKITKLAESMSSIIGVPIILCGLAEFYDGKISPKTEAEIQDLNIAEVYQKITVDKPMEIFELKNPEKLSGTSGNSRKLKSPTEIHQFFAVKNLLDKKLATNLGLTHNKKDWPLEEIARYGIATYENENDIFFNHQTYAEFLVALKLFELIESVNDWSELQKEFLIRILTEENFKVSRLFLDSMLEKVENYEDFEFFNSSQEICKLLRQNRKLLDKSCWEGLFCVSDLLLSAIFESDKKLFRNLAEGKAYNRKFRREILIVAKNEKKVGIFLDKIHEAKVDFEGFVTKKVKDNKNLFQLIAESHKKFEVLWSKCEKFIENEEKLKQFFTQKDRKNLLQISVQNENDPKVFQTVFEMATKTFNKNFDEFENFLCKTYDGNNVFTYAAKFGCAENLKYLFEKVEEILGADKVKELLRSKGTFLLSRVTVNDLEDSTQVLWQIYEKKFTREEICEILQEKQDGENILHVVAESSIENLKFLVQKLKKNIENEEKWQKLLLEENYCHENVLIVAARKSKNVFRFVLERIYCESFEKIDKSCGEDFLDDDIQNDDAEISSIEFALEKKKENEIFERFFEVKNYHGQNCLHLVAMKSDENLQYLIDFIRLKFGAEKLQKLLGETDYENSLPLHKTFEVKHIFFGSKILKNFIFLISIYEDFFTETEIEEFLKTKENNFYEENLKKVQTRYWNKHQIDDLNEVKETLVKYKIELNLPQRSKKKCQIL